MAMVQHNLKCWQKVVNDETHLIQSIDWCHGINDERDQSCSCLVIVSTTVDAVGWSVTSRYSNPYVPTLWGLAAGTPPNILALRG